MLITYNWLKQYMDLSDVTPEKLADAITKGGLEVEGYSKQAYATNLVIGKVLKCEEHPNSDHLHVCQVDVGSDVRQIVCGAPNVAEGQKVIVALPGCVLPGGEIKNGVVRNVESNGMICALFELGVDKHSLTEQQLAGIEVLPEDAEVGNTNVLEYLGLDDTIYDVSLTPNRADCNSMWAAAKDIGAVLNKKVTLPDCSYSTSESKPTLKVVSQTEKCPYFLGKVINNLEIKPSPMWIQQALKSAGVKVINNVVDISNLVMLETGQPLHFYDLAKIPAREITVKTGLNEMYTALDGVEYHVLEDDVMITTEGKAIGYAGIMGGDDSKIEEDTKGIIIEAASFNLVSVRNTSRRLNLFTEAATRFSKGIDPLAAEKAVERSTQLLLEYASASGVEETVTYGSNGYTQTTVEASVSKINKLLGTDFSYDQIKDVFARLDFQPKDIDEDKIMTYIPSYRTDITMGQDLAEEVIRILGYENVVSTLPKIPTTQANYAKNGKELREIKKVLLGNGFNEIMTYSLVSQQKIDEGILNIGEPVRVANAMSEDRRFYRTSILPSMLDTLSYNVARNNEEICLFEAAKTYSNDGEEALHLSMAMSNVITHSKWQNVKDVNDFYSMKGLILTIFDKLGYNENRISYQIPEDTKNMLHPNKSAVVLLDRKVVGIFGETHPLCDDKYDINKCVLAELDLSAILASKPANVKFVPVAKYPSVSYDLALVCKEEVTAEQINSVIKKAGGQLLKEVEIFDVYRGTGIEPGYKSIAVNVVYQSNEKTLTEADITPVHSKVISELSAKLDANLRY